MQDSALKLIKEEVQASSHPVARRIFGNDDINVLAIAFKAGQKLEEHLHYKPSKLTVLEGEVSYNAENRNEKLGPYQEVEIPGEEKHAVEAHTDSLCLLFQAPTVHHVNL